MSKAPQYHIDTEKFFSDPYPDLGNMRELAPITYVPELSAYLFTRHEDISGCEKNIGVFSSLQPDGLMHKLMGHNMMRKDGEEHLAERKMILPSVSPKTVKEVWLEAFQQHMNELMEKIASRGHADIVLDIAMPFSGRCLATITGLTNMDEYQLDSTSQRMIDGISNYAGKPEVEAACLAATTEIEDCIDDLLGRLSESPDFGLLKIMTEAKMPLESIYANIKLAISGGQNEPRDVIAGSIWALLTHPDEMKKVRNGNSTYQQVFEEYTRWMSPIGMTPRRIATDFTYKNVELKVNDRAFFMYGSANRDEDVFDQPEVFNIDRNTTKSIAFGAGPHFCIGASASRTMIAKVALPTLFSTLKDVQLAEGASPTMQGWAFRGLLDLPVIW